MTTTEELLTQENEDLTTPFENIALAFSGGGFRAAAFSLGVMSYLNSIRIAKGTGGGDQPLLEKVTYISSASGGTVTNAFYALHKANGSDFNTFYKDLYNAMNGELMLGKALETLNDSSCWKKLDKTRNIINSFSRSYDSNLLFNKATMKDLSDPRFITHLEEVCFNATEFFTGMPFRHQVKMQQWPGGIDEHFHYGNHIVSLEGDIYKQLKLGDVLASSSCFPGGFEPMVMPYDFSYESLTTEALSAKLNITPQKNDKKEQDFIKKGNLGLMDGGINDNQGLESAMKADERRRKRPGRKAGDKFQPFDLIIINDVGSFYMDPYSVPQPTGKPTELLTIGLIAVLMLLVQITGFVLLWCAIKWNNIWCSLFAGLIILIPAAVLVPYFKVHFGVKDKKNAMALNLDKTFSPSVIEQLLRFLRDTPVGLLRQITSARVNSVMILTNDVFMKRIRQLLFDSFHSNDIWENRRKSNHIYDLSFSNALNRQTKNKDNRDLGEPIQKVAEIAAAMGTTLWFDTDNDSSHNMASIIATGEFTTCNNLIFYIAKLRTAKVWAGFDQAYKDRVDAIDAQLKADWEKFMKDPFFHHNKTGTEIFGAAFQPVDHTAIPMPDYKA